MPQSCTREGGYWALRPTAQDFNPTPLTATAMVNKPPRIYISAMETEVTGLSRFDAQANSLLAKLAAAGYDVAWEKEFRGYDVIERDIAGSDALLAIVDSTWTSSTWMAIEIYYANGNCKSGMTSNPLMAPIPVFVYPVVSGLNDNLLSLKGPHFLARDPDEAIIQVSDVLPVLG